MNPYAPGYYYGSPGPPGQPLPYGPGGYNIQPVPVAADSGGKIAIIVIIGLVLFVMIMILIFWIFRRTGSGLSGLLPGNNTTLGGNNLIAQAPMIANTTVGATGTPINVSGTVPSIETTCDSNSDSHHRRRKPRRHESSSSSSSQEEYTKPSRKHKHRRNRREKKQESSSSSSSSSFSSSSETTQSQTSRHFYPDSTSRSPNSTTQQEYSRSLDNTTNGSASDTSVLSVSNLSRSESSYSNSIKAKTRTSFAKASLRGNKCVSIPELKGTVDYMKCHEGALYVHILGTKCSGIYKYKSKWECLLGTSDNQGGYSNNSNLDSTSKSAIIHLFVTNDENIGFGTITQSYSLTENGSNNVSVKKDSSPVCIDSHFNEESNARIDAKGIAYVNDQKVGLGKVTNLRLHSKARVRCYKGSLIVMTDRNNLISCQDRELKTISKNVSAYDVCDNHIAYAQRNKVSVTDTLSDTITIDLPFNASHVATSNSCIYTCT